MTKRAIVATVALYALLLQSFLVSATPAAASGPDHVLCASAGHAGTNGSDTPLRHDHLCCAAVHVGNIAPPPSLVDLVDRTARHDTIVVWRSEASLPKTGPPTHAHSARGPPTV